MFSATIAEQDLMQPRCAGHYHSTPQVTSYAFTVVAQTTIRIVVVTNLTTTEKNLRSTPRDLRQPGMDYNRVN